MFNRVILPYPRNKKENTFLDRYLLGNDLSGYRTPWAFGRLNIIERILLAQRFDDEGNPVARHCRDLDDLLPRDIERMNHLFQSAIGGSALEAGDSLGIGRATEMAKSAALDALEASLGGMAGSAHGAGAGARPVMAAPPRSRM